MNILDRIEQTKRDIILMEQKAFLEGFNEGKATREKELFEEFLSDLKEFELKRYSDMIRTLKNIREKYEQRLKE